MVGQVGPLHEPSPNSIPLFLFYVGKVKPVIDSVHKFDDVLGAYDRILTGHVRGKVVVEIA